MVLSLWKTIWQSYCCSVNKSCLTLCKPMDCSNIRPPCPSLSPEVCPSSCLMSQWCYPTSATLFLCLQSFPASGSFPMIWLFVSGSQSIGVAASASVLPMNIQGWFPNWLVWSPRCPRNSQESSPTPQFKSINSSALTLLYGPTLTSVHDYWKNHTFVYMDLYWQWWLCFY